MDQNTSKVLATQPQEPGIPISNLPFFVVGVGASAGGIDALRRLFSATPADNGMAFVVVLHLSPEHESNIAGILQAKTKMRVTQVTETVPIEPNHVYVIPPSKDLLMIDGHLQVVKATKPPGRHIAIDTFFRTLAEAHRERAVGIILSGAGSDGAVGIARIKERGGLTLAQLPDDAEYDSMPRAAILTGTVDFVLPVVEMPEKLISLAHNARSIQLPDTRELEKSLNEQPLIVHDEREVALRDVLALLQLRTGHDFTHYKRATVLRRLERRLQVNGLQNVMAYREFLEQRPEETRLLLQDMLISVTNFFRDRDTFETLERQIIPAIFREAPPGERIRAWSIGCATGEEAYSLAMLLADQAALSEAPREYQVFASDVDEQAINVARRAQYPESIITDVTPARLRQYFDKQDSHYCVGKHIREQVLFAIHNALRDPPFSRMHLISCRNLLIYLDRDIQRRVFEMMHYALHPDGYIFLGNAESADAVPELFKPVDKKHRIYRAVKNRSRAYYMQVHPQMGTLRPTEVRITSLQEREDRSVQNLHWQLLQDAAPPSLLIDQNNDLVYATKSAGRYLQPPEGEILRNVLKLTHPDLQLELRAALFQTGKTRLPVTTPPVSVKMGSKLVAVTMSLRPAPRQHAADGMTLLLFNESTESAELDLAAGHSAERTVAVHLDEELRSTKEQLRAMVDQYEAALADLKASNEELQAVNEELRSAMEELETSKEELQSVNEELVTVNAELKSKVDETTKTNDDLQNFLGATEIATIFVDRNLCIKRYSKPATKIFNLINSDLDRPLADITHRLSYPSLLQDIETVLDSFLPIESEVTSDSGEWFITRLLPYRTGADRIDGVVLTLVNITRRKEAEEQLMTSEKRMRLIAASTRDYAIATLDKHGIVTSWNSGAERLYGYNEKDMIGQSASLLQLPESRGNGSFEAELSRALQDGRAEEDCWQMRKDGGKVFCSCITSPFIDSEVQGFVKIARDLTGSRREHDQQEARMEWERQERMRAEEAARLRDEFFAVLSHELKQPLNLIQLTVEMLLRMPDSSQLPTVTRCAATIRKSVEGQVKIIDDLMDLSRLRTGKLTLSRAQVDLKETILQAVNLITSDARTKQITLEVETTDSELYAFGDELRVQQVVWNLLSNAVKFTPAAGTIKVRASQEDNFAVIEVSDSGRGIDPKFLPHVFEMFKQGDAGTNREFGGMGIGLALVKELVASHGGRVEAHSYGLGKGASFRVYLPLFMAALPDAALTSISVESLAGKRILLVEDSVETLQSLTELLGLHGADVTGAFSGEQALALARESSERFDVLISDIGMPGMDGYALLPELRKLKSTANTPAIALSGFTRTSDVQRALTAGFATHIRKPVSLDQLLSAASRAAASSRG
jgi:two-component system CheB/CheR fusion protein